MLMSFGAAGAGYEELQNAAQTAAWAGQEVLRREPAAASGNSGYFGVSLQQAGDAAQAAARAWASDVQALGMDRVFSDLNEQATVQNNQVTVTATGTFHVPWLDAASRALFGGAYAVTFQVPMRVVVTGASA
ncbi:MAG: hypothetical protein IRZ33_10315 [Alicyclobacillaceae bacterium]|nr:hypothetical protein [Alicyclobacillaceae bacterium]